VEYVKSKRTNLSCTAHFGSADFLNRAFLFHLKFQQFVSKGRVLAQKPKKKEFRALDHTKIKEKQKVHCCLRERPSVGLVVTFPVGFDFLEQPAKRHKKRKNNSAPKKQRNRKKKRNRSQFFVFFLFRLCCLSFERRFSLFLFLVFLLLKKKGANPQKRIPRRKKKEQLVSFF
jgi:hypothetical protein